MSSSSKPRWDPSTPEEEQPHDPAGGLGTRSRGIPTGSSSAGTPLIPRAASPHNPGSRHPSSPAHSQTTNPSTRNHLFCPKSKYQKGKNLKSKPTCPDPPTSSFLRYHTADSLSGTHHVRSNDRTTMTSPSPSPSHLGDFSKIDIRPTQP